MRKFVLSAFAASLMAGTALAADLPVRGPAPAPMPAPVFVAMNWSGFYVGVNAGYAGDKLRYL
jgi:outer membrane immunogenic protein